MTPYDPRAYVPGGSSLAKSRAIQALGRKYGRKKFMGVPLAPGPRQPAPSYGPRIVPKPPVNPLLVKANQLAFNMTNPLLQKLATAKAAAESNARAAYAQHASALESGLQRTAAPIASAFDTGIASAATINDAVAKRLAGQGQDASASLARQLAQIGGDPSAAAQLAQVYTGAGNAGFVKDSADLQHLVGRRSEAGSYQGKLPGIARLTANQDLQKALSQQRSQFAEQEGDLMTSAQDLAYEEYTNLRSEKLAKDQTRQQAIDNARELAAKDKMALRALRATAQTAAEKAMYASQEKALDRQLKAQITQLNADVKLATDNKSVPKVASGPNMRFNPDGSKNPNYRPPTPKNQTKGSKNDTWKTVGSAKRQRVITSIRNSIVNPETGRLRDNIVNSGTVDKTISNKIWTGMRLQGISPTSAEGKRLWRDIFASINGAPYGEGDNAGTYALPKFAGGK